MTTTEGAVVVRPVRQYGRRSTDVLPGPWKGAPLSELDRPNPRVPGPRVEKVDKDTARELAAVGMAPTASVWRQKFTRRIALTDFFIMLWAAAGAHFLHANISFSGSGPFAVKHLVTTGAILILWAVCLAAVGSRDAKIVGFGTEEYKRVLNATFIVFALVTMAGYLFKLDLPRSYLLIVMPAGLIGLIVGRWLWRKWLHMQRDHAQYSSKVLAVGSAETVAQLVSELQRSPRAGYRIVGACLTQGSSASTGAGHAVWSQDTIAGVPVVGSLDQVVSAVTLTGADAVAVTATSAFGPKAVRRLSWDLEKLSAQLILAPALTDIAGPRIHTQPVAGLPLIHVERPTYRGATRILKKTFDVLGSLSLLLVFSPILFGLAMMIKFDSKGPVFFRQERVGVDGSKFRMVKFRSMRVDAEQLLAELTAQQRDAGQLRDAGNSVLFKMKDDPRVTKVGRILRRFSLDELPQLFNVVRGDMSLVGPRPPLASEVALYHDDVRRRLLVKPGMTGLWQVSGRSDLTWDETVRLDLSYVENWSITGDLVILLKTAKAVVSSSGAY